MLVLDSLAVQSVPNPHLHSERELVLSRYSKQQSQQWVLDRDGLLYHSLDVLSKSVNWAAQAVSAIKQVLALSVC